MGFLSSLFGVSDRTPETKQIVQTSKLPEELSPYVKDVLGEAQAMYQAETERGYDPYTGEMIADFTPQEQQAMAGLESLVGTTRPYLEEAVETYRRGGDEFTAEVAEQYMSPYQRAVTDIQKREAQRDFEGTTLPRLEAQAIQQGAMSGLGSRAGVEMAEAQRNQSQLLADIEAKGQQAAFADARAGYEAQKARERAMAGDVARTGTAQLAAGLQEQGVLQTVGEQQRGMGQAILDEAYGRFLEERNFPKQTLSDYSSTIYGAAPSFKTGAGIKSTSSLPGAPSMGQQLLGLGMAGLNAYQSGGLGTLIGGGNPFMPKKAEGGPVIEAQSSRYLSPRRRSYRTPISSRFQYRDLEEEGLIKGLTEEQLTEKTTDRYGRNITSPVAQAAITQKVVEQQKNQGPSPAHVKNMLASVGGLSSLGAQGNIMSSEEFITEEGATPTSGRKPIRRPDGSIVWLDERKNIDPNIRAGLYQIAEGIGGGEILGIKMPDLEADKARLRSEISQDPRFNIEKQRARKEQAIKDTIGELEKNIERKKEIQQAGYDEESSELNTFIDEQTDSIMESGASTSDIVAEAIDQGMKEPTIVTMLTKVLNTNEKGLQKRARETRKELRELKKQQFTMEKEARKGERTDKLANAQLKSEATLKKIAMKLGMEEQLDSLSSQAKTELMNRLAKEVEIKGKAIGNVMDVYKTMATLLTAQRTLSGGKGGTGKSFTAPEKQVDAFAANKFGYVIDGPNIRTTGGDLIDSSMPAFKNFQALQAIGRRVYKDTLQQLGTDHDSQVVAQQRAEQAINNLYSSQRGGGTGSIPPAAQRTSGQVYNTPRGPLKWTGTGWTQP